MPNYSDEILERLHATELEILEAMAAVCKEEGLNWFLIGGSVLGAMRHQGFIPWDDDIDTGMLREDYDRFLEVAPKKLPPEFELVSPMTTPGYAPMFAKVVKKGTRFCAQEAVDAGLDLGIFVDIFPRDRVAAVPCCADVYARFVSPAFQAHHPRTGGIVRDHRTQSISAGPCSLEPLRQGIDDPRCVSEGHLPLPRCTCN